jgi:hypothetical protein
MLSGTKARVYRVVGRDLDGTSRLGEVFLAAKTTVTMDGAPAGKPSPCRSVILCLENAFLCL